MANPVRCSEANRKSPDLSPVKSRPVRLPPWAAGASPTTRMRAAGSPNPGNGRAQYRCPEKRAGGLAAASSRHATSRGQRRQATTSAATISQRLGRHASSSDTRAARSTAKVVRASRGQMTKAAMAPGRVHDRVVDVRHPVREAFDERAGVLGQLDADAEGDGDDDEPAPVAQRRPQSRAVDPERHEDQDVAGRADGSC